MLLKSDLHSKVVNFLNINHNILGGKSSEMAMYIFLNIFISMHSSCQAADIK